MSKFGALFLGLTCGAGLLFSLNQDALFTARKAGAAIEQCEASLPRDQHCKIVAVVDTGAAGD